MTAYQYRCIVSGACTPPDTSSVATLTVHPLPGASVTAAGPTSFCSGGSVLLNANTGSGLTYNWQRDGTDISAATASNYTAVQSGAYRVIVSNSSNCTDTSTALTVTVIARPGASVAAAGPSSFCSGGSVLLNANTGSGLSYQWQRDGADISTATASSYTAVQSGAYRVLVSNTSNCTDTSTAITVTVIAGPGASVTASGPTSFCSGGSVVLNANIGSGLSYQWQRDGADISTATASSYTAVQSGAYRVLVSNTSNCTDTSTAITVTVIAGPGASVTASGPTSFCSGGSVVLNANIGSGLSYQWQRDGADISAATASNYTAVQSGAYRVIVSNSSNCTDTSSALTVTVIAGPGASVTAAGPSSFCSGGSVLLNANTGSGLTYQWQRDGTDISAATASSYTAVQSGAYRVIVRNTSNCTDTSSALTVTVIAGPGASVTATGATSFCSGGSVLLNANTGSGLTYQWQRDGTDIATATDSSYTAVQSGAYRVIVSNTSNCTDTSSLLTVTVIAGPGASVTAAGPTSFCSGGSVLLNANTSTGTPYRYRWQRDGADISGAARSSFTATQGGTYRVIVSNDQSCSDTSSTITLTLYPAPVANAGPDTVVCQGESVAIGRSATGGAGVYSYAWVPTTGLNSPDMMQPIATPLATTSYIVSVTDGNGCTAQDTVLVTVFPSPVPSISASGPTSFCTGDSIVLSAAPGYATYFWHPNGETVDRIVVATSGTYYVEVTDTHSCRGVSMPITVIVHMRPEAIISGPVAVCPNTQAEYAVPVQHGVTYAWTVQRGTIISGNGTATIRVQWDATGPGMVSVVLVHTQSGCVGLATEAVDIHTTLRPKILPERPSFCAGGSVELDAGPGYSRYSWSTGELSRRIVVTSAGSYSVEVDDGTGCRGSDTVLVSELPLPLPVIEALGPLSMCEGDNVTLRTQGTYVRYLWLRDDVPTGDTLRFCTVNTSGSYKVEVEDRYGCRGVTQAVAVAVNASPEARISGPTSACENGISVYTASPTGSYRYYWEVTGGTIESGQGAHSLTVRWLGVGGGYVQLIVTEVVSGCSDTSSVIVLITQGYEARVRVLGDSILCQGDTVTLEAEAGYENYEWTTGERTRSITITQSGVYQVRVFDAFCEGRSHPVRITVLPAPVPSVFASGATTLCEGDSVQLSTTEKYVGYRWRPGGETTASITVRSSGFYGVEVEDAYGCHGASDSVAVLVAPIPDASIVGVRSACAGSRQQYTARAGYSYTWFVTGGTILSGENTRSIEVEWMQSGIVMLRIRELATGCEAESMDSVRVSETLQPSITVVGAKELCVGDSVVLRADKGYYAYRWSTGSSADTLVVYKSGEYSVFVTDNGGCSGGSEAVRVTVHASPRPVILAEGPVEFCRGESVTLRTEQAYASYRWSTGATDATIQVREGGSYRVTAWNTAGCAGMSEDLLVTVRPLHPPRIFGAASVCVGGEREYTVVDDTTGAFTYTWMAVNGVMLGTENNTARIAWPTVGTGRVIVGKHESASGCIAADTADVKVGSVLQPIVSVLHGPNVCRGDTVVLEADGGYATYIWNTGEQVARIRIARSGLYSVTVTDSTGCSGTSLPITVTVSAAPTPEIIAIGAVTFCLGDSVILRTRESYASYRWSNGATSPAVTIKTAGTFFVEVEDANGCRGVSEICVVTVTPAETPRINGPPSICTGEIAEYSTQSSASLISWSITGDGEIMAGQGSAKVSVKWNSTGIGTVAVRIRDTDTGCEAGGRLVVEVQDELSVNIEVAGRLRLCEGETVLLRVPSGYASYLWNTGATTESIYVHGSGAYFVVVRSNGGCTGSSDTVLVETLPPPRPLLTTRDATMFCNGDSARLEASIGYVRYTWWRDGSMLHASTASVVVRTAGTYSVMVEDAHGCVGTSSPVDITVYPSVTPVITLDDRTLTATPARTWQWYLNDTLLAGLATQSIEAPRPGRYRVRITDRNGCAAESEPVHVTFAAASCILALPDIQLSPGERATIPVLLTEAHNLHSAGALRFSAVLVFDRTMLNPVTEAYRDSAGLRKVLLTGLLLSPGQTVASLDVEALWGASDETALTLEDANWESDAVHVTVLPGRVRVDLCREGGVRFYRASGSTRILGNRPNPFNTFTVIDYEVGEAGPMELSVHDALGRSVTVLHQGEGAPGIFTAVFDAHSLPSGPYVAILRTATSIALRRIILAK
jgi:hypothetical protein